MDPGGILSQKIGWVLPEEVLANSARYNKCDKYHKALTNFKKLNGNPRNLFVIDRKLYLIFAGHKVLLQGSLPLQVNVGLPKMSNRSETTRIECALGTFSEAKGLIKYTLHLFSREKKILIALVVRMFRVSIY